MISNEPVAAPQQGEVLSFRRRKSEQSVLPQEGDLHLVYDHIRMLDASTDPLAFVEHGNCRLEFSNAQFMEDEVIAKVVIRNKPVE